MTSYYQIPGAQANGQKKPTRNTAGGQQQMPGGLTPAQQRMWESAQAAQRQGVGSISAQPAGLQQVSGSPAFNVHQQAPPMGGGNQVPQTNRGVQTPGGGSLPGAPSRAEALKQLSRQTATAPQPQAPQKTNPLAALSGGGVANYQKNATRVPPEIAAGILERQKAAGVVPPDATEPDLYGNTKPGTYSQQPATPSGGQPVSTQAQAAPGLQAPPGNFQQLGSQQVPMTGNPEVDSQNILRQQAQSSLPQEQLFMERLQQFFDPSRLDPANDPTMKPLLDAMRQENMESQRGALNANAASAGASGMYGSSLRALEDAAIKDQFNENLLGQQGQAMFGARQNALQQMMQGLGLQNDRSVAQGQFNQGAANALGQQGLGSRGLDIEQQLGNRGIDAQIHSANQSASAAGAAAAAQLEGQKYMADIEHDLGMRGYDVQELLGLGGQDVQLQLGLGGLDSQNMYNMGSLDLQRELGLRGMEMGAANSMMGGDFARLGMLGGLGGSIAGQQQGALGALGGLFQGETDRMMGAGQLGLGLGQQGLARAGMNQANNQYLQDMAFRQQAFAEQQRSNAFNEYMQLLMGAGGQFGTQHVEGLSPGGPVQPVTNPWVSGITAGLGGYFGAGGNFSGFGGGGGGGNLTYPAGNRYGVPY